MNSYDIIANAVRTYRNYQHEKGRCEDLFYIVSFKQSHNPIKDFQQCTEIVELSLDSDELTFMMDFCEGEQYVIDIVVIGLGEIGDLMNRIFKLLT